MKRVLIPYYLGGEGHRSFAHAIQSALADLEPKWEVTLLNVAQELSSPELQDFYVQQWKNILKLPFWVQKILFFFNHICPWPTLLANHAVNKSALDKAIVFLKKTQPDMIIATHWGAGHVFDMARQIIDPGIPLWCIYCELGGAYRLVDCKADRFFYITQEARQALETIGIPTEKLYPCSFPIQPSVFQIKAVSSSKPTQAQCFTAVFSLGGEGIGRTMDFVRHHALYGKIAQMIVLTGRNSAMKTSLEQDPVIASSPLIKVFGFLEDITEVFSSADIFVGKFGTSLAGEAMFLGKPMVIVQLAAPHEAYTKDFLVNHGYAWYLTTPDACTKKLEELASNPDAYAEHLAGMDKTISFTGGMDIARAAQKFL